MELKKLMYNTLAMSHQHVSLTDLFVCVYVFLCYIKDIPIAQTVEFKVIIPKEFMN